MTRLLHPLLQPRILGILIAFLFIAGSGTLGYLLDNYSFISQTLSEIGSMSSPMKLPFQILKVLVSLLTLAFSFVLLQIAKERKLSIIPPLFLLLFGLSDLGLALFPTPHPWHNIFGLSLTLGYMSPLLFGLLWSTKVTVNFRGISLVFFAMIALGIFLNLSPMFKPDLYPLQYYGDRKSVV